MTSLSALNIAQEQLRKTVASAVRALRRAPVFTLVVAVTLALGIGANAAVIGVIDTLYFRKLPVPHPERVVGIYSGDKRNRSGRVGASQSYGSLRDYRELRTRLRGVSGLAAFSMASVYPGGQLAGDGVWTAFVSGNYFDVLDVRAQLGRTIRPDEEEPAGAHPVVVISDFIWRTAFAADPRVLGRELPIGTKTFTIVGVAPKGFTGAHPEGRTNLWIPLGMARVATGDSAAAPEGGTKTVQMLARLAPGATLDEVRASATIASDYLREAYPASDSLIALHALIRDRLTTFELSPDALVEGIAIWVMIALLHLVACSNVASLMLGRAAARRREVGVRLCLGATRARILVESLTEAGLLAFIGAAGGLVVGRWLSGLIAGMQFLSTSDPGLDVRVVAIVGIITAATVLQFGVVPALDAARSDPLAILRGANTSRRAGGRDRFGMIIVSQVTVSLLLLANAAVFVQLFARQTNADPGYDVQHLLTASVEARLARSTPADWSAAYDDARARVSAVPGVVAVAAARGAPLYNASWYQELVVPGRAPAAAGDTPSSLQAIGPGYFAAIGAPMVRGREFTADDRVAPGGARDVFDVVIVNEAMARKYWPGVDPLGQRIGSRSGTPATVVGVVRDMHDVSTVRNTPRAYFPLLESRYAAFDLVVRVSGDPRVMLPRIGAALQSSTAFARPALRSMESIRYDALSLSRVAGTGLAICAGVALLLTAIGLFGIVSMWAARRRGEIGIRLALGAPTHAVHRLLLAEVARLVGVGSALGLACAVGVVQVERGMFGPILSLGVVPLVASIVVFAAIGGLAAFIPSLRATRQPPAEVLRSG